MDEDDERQAIFKKANTRYGVAENSYFSNGSNQEALRLFTEAESVLLPLLEGAADAHLAHHSCFCVWIGACPSGVFGSLRFCLSTVSTFRLRGRALCVCVVRALSLSLFSSSCRLFLPWFFLPSRCHQHLMRKHLKYFLAQPLVEPMFEQTCISMFLLRCPLTGKETHSSECCIFHCDL